LNLRLIRRSEEISSAVWIFLKEGVHSSASKLSHHNDTSLMNQHKLRLLLLLMGLSISNVLAQKPIFPQPLSPRIANYDISVSLNAKDKMISATETLVWRNTSRDRITELQFHLYLNGFRKSESTFMKESQGSSRGAAMDVGGWGWINIDAIAIRGGEDLTAKMEFIHPDDGNAADQTVMRVRLARPVLPNQTITLDISFTAKMPTVFARTGYYDDFFMVAQWFPKIGVYEPAGMRYATTGQWNCHQFHANTEFYADYGVYNVDITVPRSFVVGATGVRERERLNGDTTKTLFYHAEDVHDFAWTASPRYEVVEDTWEHVAIRLLIQPEHRDQAERYIQSTKAALQYFHDWVGKYPYPNLTIVDPPIKAFGAAGMEYPTLITGGSIYGMIEGLKLTELVTVHEFGHQYWYGLVGNNEFEEAWLDEGINQYSETRIMDETYGVKTSNVDFLGYRLGDLESARQGYLGMSNPKIAPTRLNGWEYKAGGYGNLTYSKTAVFMSTLERLLGRPVMDEIMRTYFERWKFRHPSSRDFIAVVNEITKNRLGSKYGNDMNWYFDQVLYGTDICDYELTSIRNRRISRPEGVLYEAWVVVSRLGEVRMPVEVLVHFDSGKEVREQWDGQARWKEFKYTGDDRIQWAMVDPDEVLQIDINFLNNSKTLDVDSTPAWKYTVKFLFWIQNILQTSSLF
jgi:hypothetical protein